MDLGISFQSTTLLSEMSSHDFVITPHLVKMLNFCSSRVSLLAEIERFVHLSSTEVIMLLEFTDRCSKYLPPNLIHCKVQCHLVAEDINHH